jgi:Mg-chelatase subunit ChlD
MVYLETMAANAGMVYNQPVYNFPKPARTPNSQNINIMPIKTPVGAVSYLGLCKQCGLADPLARLDVYDGFFYCTGCWQVYEENASRGNLNEWFHRQLVEANVFEVRGPDVSNYVEKFKSKKGPRKGVSFANDVKKEDGRGDTWAVCAEVVDEEIQRHIVLVLDMSGSMRLEDVVVFDRFVSRAEAVRLAALEFLAAQDDKAATYSAVTFNSEASVICRRKQRDEVYETVRHARFAAWNTTEYTKGLNAALDLADEDDNLEIVLLSDGRPGDAHKALSLQGELAKKRTRVHAIGLDPSATQYLQQLAAISGGSYVESARSLTSMRTAFTTVSTAIATTHGATNEQVLKDVQFEVPNAHTGEPVKCSRSWFYFDGTSFTEHKSEDREVSVREKPFTQGGMRLVHGLHDASLPQVKAHRMVAKYSKYVDNDTPEFTLYASKSVAVAKFFVRCFEHAATPEMLRTVKFIVLECYRYIAEDGKSFVGERYLPGAFTKFNSNNGYVDSEHPLTEMVQALSHFSYQASEGEYLVADLQGVVAGSENRCFCFFTDPQVLSVRKEFGPADLGAAGMRKFFARHRCGPTCEALGLCGGGKDDFEVVPSELGCGSSVLSQLLSDEEDDDDEDEDEKSEDLGDCEQAATIAEDLAAAVLGPTGGKSVLRLSLSAEEDSPPGHPRSASLSTDEGPPPPPRSESSGDDDWAVL